MSFDRMAQKCLVLVKDHLQYWQRRNENFDYLSQLRKKKKILRKMSIYTINLKKFINISCNLLLILHKYVFLILKLKIYLVNVQFLGTKLNTAGLKLPE